VRALPRNALHVEITPEDEMYAQQKDKWACAIVRAIQRQLPEALRVTADVKTIRFSLPGEGHDGQGTRYIFETPREVINHVIRAFDTTGKIDPEFREFTLRHAIDAKPLTTGSRRRTHASQERNRQRRTRSINPNVHTYGRFQDALADEGCNE
jgi:hypothetical protein